MNLSFVVLEGSNIMKSLHTLISITFSIVALWLVIRSIRGIRMGTAYRALDKYLSYSFIITLYLQLIFGLILYANPSSAGENKYTGIEDALKLASKRFWPIEHIVLMLFALMIANLGLIVSAQTNIDKEKHRKILIYYVVALMMIIISLSAI
ncbi:MAG: hypothetical protein WCL21_15515 [Mariniphaga sp.]